MSTLFFKRTILLLIHYHFLQFWYQCTDIKKTSIYQIIGNFPPKLPLQHTENGQSLRFHPIRKVDLRGLPLNSENGISLPLKRYTKLRQRMISN